jgi:phage FluMu protein Com
MLNIQTQVVKPRAIKCPMCSKGKLINAMTHYTFVNVRTHSPPFSHAVEYTLKCPSCKNQIGISINQ